jgi:choline dehydrogenase-like flavoprotein
MLEFLKATSPDRARADVCIAGAGPAGIVLALTLAESGISSVLLEGGGLAFPEQRELELYQGDSTGIPYPLAASRLRYFGGTSGHWGGWCKPLDPVDFESHSFSDLPSWPISGEELSGHYARALQWCEIGNGDFDAESSVENARADLLFEPGMAFTQQLFRFSPPTRFGSRYLEDIRASELVRCFCQANLVSLSHAGDQIVSAHAMSLDGDRLEIQADHFVLAMGGVENARFLLHTRSDDGVPFGNASGLLGRCFMDHFGFTPGFMNAASGLRLYRHRSGDGDIQPVVTASSDFQRSNSLPSICAIATPQTASDDLPAAYFSNPGVLDAGITTSSRYQLQFICEPGIHRQSSITLGDKRDALGMQKVRLNWHLSDDDYDGAERFASLLSTELGVNGLGRMQRTGYFDTDRRNRLTAPMHHMGTTRMSDSTQHGVVDAECRVHGSGNLHIAGSSVFPRSGYSNPTLTIVALADRLAGTLAGRG